MTGGNEGAIFVQVRLLSLHTVNDTWVLWLQAISDKTCCCGMLNIDVIWVYLLVILYNPYIHMFVLVEWNPSF